MLCHPEMEKCSTSGGSICHVSRLHQCILPWRRGRSFEWRSARAGLRYSEASGAGVGRDGITNGRTESADTKIAILHLSAEDTMTG